MSLLEGTKRKKLPKGFGKLYYLTINQARKIFQAWAQGQSETRVNLHLEYTDREFRVLITRKEVIFPQVGLRVSIKRIKKIVRSEDSSVYLLKPDGLQKIVFYNSGRVYRLLGTVPPGLEINGIRMHSQEPLKDLRAKIQALRIRRGDKVLDIGTGLGYTAIAAAELGAHVTTIESDPNVIELAKINPFSAPLFSSKDIELIMADVLEWLPEQEEETWTVIIHDPPRLGKHTGDLYSTELYHQFYRVLKPFGRLYHYTGSPGSRYRKRDLPHTITKRLADVGFKVKMDREALGVIAIKSASVR